MKGELVSVRRTKPSLLIFSVLIVSSRVDCWTVSSKRSRKNLMSTKSLQMAASHFDLPLSRREAISSSSAFLPGILSNPGQVQAREVSVSRGTLRDVVDDATYAALVYEPKRKEQTPLPLLVVLHGAGRNHETVWSLADPLGEHAGLAPSLLFTGRAPTALADKFAMVAPYSAGKRSFYEEPRSKILQFIEWVCSEAGQRAGCPYVDPNSVYLFGFSDGATLAVELATTRRFRACTIAAYGFSGTLPKLALDRLKGIPFWVFHSADDVIFPVVYSDRLVTSLRTANTENTEIIRYTRYDKDQENFEGSVRGHSTGITATKLPEVYEFLLTSNRA
jgi:predicted esterase